MKKNMNEFAFLMWLVPFISLRAIKSNLPLHSSEVELPCPTFADRQSVADGTEIEENLDMENEADSSGGDYEVFNDELDTLELPPVSRKRAVDSNISQVTRREKWVKITPQIDREELCVLKSMQKAFLQEEDKERDESEIFECL